MKKFIATLAIAIIALSMNAQVPPSPNGGSNPGGGNNPVGGGAPIDSGIIISLVLGVGYGLKKTLKNKLFISTNKIS